MKMQIDWNLTAVLVLSVLTVATSVMVLLSHSLMKATLWLIFNMTLIAGLYITQEADFLAASQLVVYVGGVLLLITMALVMTKSLKTESNDPSIVKTTIIMSTMALVGVLFWLETEKLGFNSPNQSHVLEPTKEIGRALSTNMILIFELIAFILTLALVSSFYVMNGIPKKND